MALAIMRSANWASFKASFSFWSTAVRLNWLVCFSTFSSRRLNSSFSARRNASSRSLCSIAARRRNLRFCRCARFSSGVSCFLPRGWSSSSSSSEAERRSSPSSSSSSAEAWASGASSCSGCSSSGGVSVITYSSFSGVPSFSVNWLLAMGHLK